MQLDEYLRQKNLSHDEFAALIGKHRTSVSRFIAGTRKPDLQTIQEIHRVTKGKVRAEDFFEGAAS